MKDKNGNEYEIDHIDYIQLDKEKEEKILKSNKFIRALFLIGAGDDDVVQVEFSHFEPYMLIPLMVSMRDVLLELAKKHPAEWSIAKNIKSQVTVNEQKIDDEENENE